MNKYYTILRKKIIEQITADLTIGRSDHNLNQCSKEEIKEFIKENNNKIDIVINNIIDAYNEHDEIDELEVPEDDELDELENPDNDLITEFLYDVIDTGFPIEDNDNSSDNFNDCSSDEDQ
jgi:hypothetical protein